MEGQDETQWWPLGLHCHGRGEQRLSFYMNSQEQAGCEQTENFTTILPSSFTKICRLNPRKIRERKVPGWSFKQRLSEGLGECTKELSTWILYCWIFPSHEKWGEKRYPSPDPTQIILQHVIYKNILSMSEERAPRAVLRYKQPPFTSPLVHQQRIWHAEHWPAPGKDPFSKIALQRTGKPPNYFIAQKLAFFPSYKMWNCEVSWSKQLNSCSISA